MKLSEDEWVCGMEELQENVALFSFAGGVVDDGFFESLEWKNSIKHDHILLISLSNFRIYGIKKVKFNYLGDENFDEVFY